jgi:hypothetical protein
MTLTDRVGGLSREAGMIRGDALRTNSIVIDGSLVMAASRLTYSGAPE